MKLLFVYNADSDMFSKATDFAHKIVSPSTYQCSLCSLTHGNISKKREWSDFIRSLDIETEFLYRDKVEHDAIDQYEYPAVFVKKGGDLNVLLSKKELDQLSSLEALIRELKSRIGKLSRADES